MIGNPSPCLPRRNSVKPGADVEQQDMIINSIIKKHQEYQQ